MRILPLLPYQCTGKNVFVLLLGLILSKLLPFYCQSLNKWLGALHNVLPLLVLPDIGILMLPMYRVSLQVVVIILAAFSFVSFADSSTLAISKSYIFVFRKNISNLLNLFPLEYLPLFGFP